MIKNIVFDMGNVLLDYNPVKFVSKFTSDKNEQNILLKEVFESQEWIAIDKGEISLSEVETAVTSRVPENLKSKALEILNNWYKYFDEISDVEEILKDLKEKGYKLYILSNAGDQINKYKDKSVFKYFDGLLFSSEVKMIKPDKKIFEELFNRFKIKPEESYFIDDSLRNIEAALDMEMKGYNFVTKDINGDLRSKLTEEGIL